MKQEHDFEHAVFKCAALVENQADADRSKQICIDNNLPIWDRRDAFDILNYDENNYIFFSGNNHFYVDCIDPDDYEDSEIVSLTQFQTLAENYSSHLYQSIDDILSKIKELNNLLNNK
jgi:hypothetical protein